jgi:hypothetical protein
MTISRFTTNVNNHQALSDNPNANEGLTATELKIIFDKAPTDIKDYLNNTFLPALESTTSGSSGALQIGISTIAGTTSQTIQDALIFLAENKVTSTDVKFIRLNVDNVIETSTNGTTWTATGSSGHIIINNEGTALPQRSRLKFLNTTISDDGTQTIVQGLTGPTGPTGPQGIQGPVGPTGSVGPKGNSIIPTVDATTGIMTFTEGQAGVIPSPVYVKGPQGPQGVQGPQGIQGVQGNAGPQGDAGSRGLKGDTGDKGDKGDTGLTGATGSTGAQGPTGPQGPRGEKGADGTSFAIKGLYATLYALQTAHPTGSAGDAYAVGTSTSNVIYNWSVDNSTWESLGALQGPVGPQGIQGIQGPQGLTGPAGATGATGATGPQGPQGDIGKGYYPQSTWSSASVPYVNSSTQIDVVLYNGSSYFCKVSHTSSGSILPTNTTYWGILAQKGDTGPAPDTSTYAIKDGAIQTNLNADLLDGQHGSYYASASSVSAKADTTYVDTQVATKASTTYVDAQNALDAKLGANNQSVNQIKAYPALVDSRTTELVYTSGTLTGVNVKDGATTVSSTTLNYTSGVLTSVVEVVNGKTITTTLNYTSGTLTSVSKAVV